jgi:hypothetical protein
MAIQDGLFHQRVFDVVGDVDEQRLRCGYEVLTRLVRSDLTLIYILDWQITFKPMPRLKPAASSRPVSPNIECPKNMAYHCTNSYSH